jgi:hypothetical protein
MKLVVKTKHGSKFLIEADDAYNVGDLKKLIKKAKGFSLETQKIVFNRKILGSDEQKLEGMMAEMIDKRKTKLSAIAKKAAEDREAAGVVETDKAARARKKEEMAVFKEAIDQPYEGCVVFVKKSNTATTNPMKDFWKKKVQRDAQKEYEKKVDREFDLLELPVVESDADKQQAVELADPTDPGTDNPISEPATNPVSKAQVGSPVPPATAQKSKTITNPSPLTKRLNKPKSSKGPELHPLTKKFSKRFGWFSKKGVTLSAKGVYLSKLPGQQDCSIKLELRLGLRQDPLWPIAPADLFKTGGNAEKYAGFTFDDRGVPTVSADGTAITQKAKEKLEKLHAAHLECLVAKVFGSNGEVLASKPLWMAPKIYSLNISCCSIDSDSAKLVAQALGAVGTIQILNVSCNKLMGRWAPKPVSTTNEPGGVANAQASVGSQCASPLASTAKDGSASMNPVWLDDFSGAEKLVEAIAKSTSLTDVNMASNMLCTARIGSVLGEHLQTNKKLVCLNICNNEGNYILKPPCVSTEGELGAAAGTGTSSPAGDPAAATTGTDVMGFAQPIAAALRGNTTLQRLVFGNGRSGYVSKSQCKLPGPSLDFYNGESVIYNGQTSTITACSGDELELNLNVTLDAADHEFVMTGRNMSSADALIAAAFLPRCERLTKVRPLRCLLLLFMLSVSIVNAHC